MTQEADSQTLSVNYGGATIKVQLTSPPGACLMINQITRATHASEAFGCFRLSSTVQTDYEWHEFIEAIIDCSESSTLITIEASKQCIAEKSFPAFPGWSFDIPGV